MYDYDRTTGIVYRTNAKPDKVIQSTNDKFQSTKSEIFYKYKFDETFLDIIHANTTHLYSLDEILSQILLLTIKKCHYVSVRYKLVDKKVSLFSFNEIITEYFNNIIITKLPIINTIKTQFTKDLILDIIKSMIVGNGYETFTIPVKIVPLSVHKLSVVIDNL